MLINDEMEELFDWLLPTWEVINLKIAYNVQITRPVNGKSCKIVMYMYITFVVAISFRISPNVNGTAERTGKTRTYSTIYLDQTPRILRTQPHTSRIYKMKDESEGRVALVEFWKMRMGGSVLALVLCNVYILRIEAFKGHKIEQIERISGSAGDVLEDDPVGRLKVFVYEIPSKYNKKIVDKDSRCLKHMFAAEIYVHQFLLSSPVRTLNPEEADWFHTPVYTTCDLTRNGHPISFESPGMMSSAIQIISSNWPYWNRTEGADHFFIVPHDFGACFHYQEEKAIVRGILGLLQRATLVQTFGQRNHVCLQDGSIIIPPYSPPQKMQAHLIPPTTPRNIFVYFRGLFYDVGSDPEGGYYARGARAAVWENFKDNPLFDISTEHPTTYYEDMQRAIFCLCPLGWAPWSPRLVEAVVFGCIPVIIADGIVLPFADAIPWEEIGVFVAEEDVQKLDTILTSIPIDEILRKQRLLANPSMKQAMLFQQPPQPRDAFHQILNGLVRKLPHDKSVFLKPGEKILNWTVGPVV